MNEPLSVMFDPQMGLIDFICLGCGKKDRVNAKNQNKFDKFVSLNVIDSKCISCKSEYVMFKNMSGIQLWVKKLKDV